MRWDLIVAAALHFAPPSGTTFTDRSADRVVAYLHQHRRPDAHAVELVVDAAVTQAVPTTHLLAVCTRESGVGASPHAHLLCGVMGRSPAYDIQAGSAAVSLAHRYRNCGAWSGAFGMYQSGRWCVPNDYSREVLAIVRRLDRWTRFEFELDAAERRWQSAHGDPARDDDAADGVRDRALDDD